MFQVAMFSVSSSLDGGIFALAILDRRTFRPLAISGETFPWFMAILPVESDAAYYARPAFAPSSARQILSGVAGMSKWGTPAPRSASATAFMIAGSEPLTPASPTPFAPSGLDAVGTG